MEIIADNSARPVGVGIVFQRLIPTGERSGLQTRRDDGKHFVVRADEKLTAVLELESAICDQAEGPEDCGAVEITLDNRQESSKSLLDYVIRQFHLFFGTAE